MKELILAAGLTFIVAFLVAHPFIRLLKRLKFGQQVREDGPQSHLSKQNTPTMGGVIMLAAVVVGALVFRLNQSAFIALLMAGAYSVVGLLDDLIKIVKKRSLGLRAYQKIIGQFGIAIIIAVYAANNPAIGTTILLPFQWGELDLGIFYIPVAVFIILAIVNGVNLVDGLDGLATGVSTVMMGIFCVLCAIGAAAGTAFSGQLHGLSIFAALVIGACLGFLPFNTYPARTFMGDCGAFMLGGALAGVALFSRMALVFPLVGGMVVVTVVSVILQVGSYKIRRKRIFLMAPIHHHFELKGYHETKIVAMYMLATLLLGMVALLIF